MSMLNVLHRDPLLEELSRKLDDFASRASFGFAIQREAAIEPFAMSGAFVNELTLAVGPMTLHTSRTPDGGLIVSATEKIRVI